MKLLNRVMFVRPFTTIGLILLAIAFTGCGKTPKNEYTWFQHADSITLRVTFTSEKGKVSEYDEVSRKIEDVVIEGDAYCSVGIQSGDAKPHDVYARVKDAGIYTRESKLKGDVETLELPSPAIVGQKWRAMYAKGNFNCEVVAIEDIMLSGKVHESCVKVKYTGEFDGNMISGESYYASGIGKVLSHSEIEGVGVLNYEYVEPVEATSKSKILSSAKAAIDKVKETLADSDFKMKGKKRVDEKRTADVARAKSAIAQAEAIIAQAESIVDESQSKTMKIVQDLFNVRGDSVFCYVRTPDPLYGKFTGVQTEYEISGFKESRSNKLPVSSRIFSRADHIVPLSMKVGSFDIKAFHFAIRDL